MRAAVLKTLIVRFNHESQRAAVIRLTRSGPGCDGGVNDRSLPCRSRRWRHETCLAKFGLPSVMRNPAANPSRIDRNAPPSSDRTLAALAAARARQSARPENNDRAGADHGSAA